jgi:hypothetical protein
MGEEKPSFEARLHACSVTTTCHLSNSAPIGIINLSRLVRQLLTESLLLAGLGGGAGLLLAWWSLKAFLTSALLSQSPTAPHVGTMTLFLNPDARVLTYTFLLSLFAGLAFGLLPALRATRTDLVSTLKDEGTAFGRRLTRSRSRNGLVVAQVALSMILLLASGLLLRGVMRGSAVDPGFETENLLQLYPRTGQAGYDQTRALQFREGLASRLEALPGVRQVSMAHWMMTGQGLRLVVIGVALGMAGGAAVSRVFSSLLFGLSPFDPIAYVSVSLFLVAVALVAIYLPARRAAQVDPMIALRCE